MEDTKKEYPHSDGAKENAYDRAIKAENEVKVVRAEMSALRIKCSRLQLTIMHLLEISQLIPIDDQHNHISDILSLPHCDECGV